MVLLEKLTGLQQVKKFPEFHGTWTHYRTQKRPPPVPILGQPNPVHIPISHLLEIHPNIIHPSMPRSPHWSLSLRFAHQDPIHPPSPQQYTPHAQPISFFSILSPAQYWVRSTNHLAPRYAISSIPRYLFPHWSEYSPEHHVLKHPQLRKVARQTTEKAQHILKGSYYSSWKLVPPSSQHLSQCTDVMADFTFCHRFHLKFHLVLYPTL